MSLLLLVMCVCGVVCADCRLSAAKCCCLLPGVCSLLSVACYCLLCVVVWRRVVSAVVRCLGVVA